MLGFVFGFAAGAATMYFGSDKVRENVEATTQMLRQQEQSKQHIQQQTQELLIKWIHEGTLIENLKLYEARLRIIYHEELSPQIWQDAMMLNSSYASR